jgi:hypothetical protein
MIIAVKTGGSWSDLATLQDTLDLIQARIELKDTRLVENDDTHTDTPK